MSRATTAELQRIARDHGGVLKPADVVDEASSPSSLLHPYFTWDDSEAGRLYRLVEAERLIRVSVVVIEDEVPRETRCFVSLSEDRVTGGGYRETLTVLSDDQRRDQLLREARAEMGRFIRKYRDLEDVAKVIAAMNGIISAA